MVGPAAIRRPEYTGENRCLACTLVNVVLLGAACLLVGLVHPAAALVAAAVGGALVWYRGYLVPYTPRFAPRLVAWLPVVEFGPRHGHASLDPGVRSGTGRSEEDATLVLEALVEAGVIQADGDGLVLADDFRERWNEEVDQLAALEPDGLARAALDASTVAESSEAVEGSDESFVVLSDGAGNVSWLPRPVAVAETAAARALAHADVPPERRDLAAHATCAFIERCPVCDGEVVEASADSCCGGTVPSPTVEPPRVLACTACDVSFFTLEAS